MLERNIKTSRNMIIISDILFVARNIKDDAAACNVLRCIKYIIMWQKNIRENKNEKCNSKIIKNENSIKTEIEILRYKYTKIK